MKIQHQPAGRPQNSISPQFPMELTQQQAKGKARQDQAIHHIQHGGAAGIPAPKRLEQIIQHAGPQSQQDRLAELHQLL